MSGPSLGLSGRLTRTFITSPLTPLILLLAVLLGGIALMVLPREEEPQISVPMVDIMVRADGLKAAAAEERITRPLEDIVKGIKDVEHVYSQTEDDQVVVTARFKVGTNEDTAALRIHEHLRAHYDRMPAGVPEPLIVARGINDVAALVLTLSPKPGLENRWTSGELYKLARDLQHELDKVDNVGLTYIVGGAPDQIRVEPDPAKLARYGVTLDVLSAKIAAANASFPGGYVRESGSEMPVEIGNTLRHLPDVGHLLLTTHAGHPVYVRDVATIALTSRPDDHITDQITVKKGVMSVRPAVSLAFAKREGSNAVVVGKDILERLQTLKGRLIPDSVQVDVTRDYGRTAQDKADELLFHLELATLSIVLLISLFVGWREGAVVFIVIPTTILLTFFAAWMMGYTINRVSLFALIFSIGILVDDAIVVIENIVRHWKMAPQEDRVHTAVLAVAEVGNPTIIATLTIVAALLPMMFVSGLMGPYMSPIPANASAAMLFSFFVAVTIAPWLMMRFGQRLAQGGHGHDESGDTPLGRLYRRLARPVLASRRNARLFLACVVGATIAVCVLFYTKTVTVKLLPFDNKSEVQVVLDLPRGSSLEETQRTLLEASRLLASLPELTSIQSYAGTAAPFNFNGLVRHYYLRQQPQMGDLMINLLPKDERDRASHAIALDIRHRLQALHLPNGSALKVVEVPPGPPVLSTLLAEVYGSSPEARRDTARRLRKVFEQVPFIVDVDDSFGVQAERMHVVMDRTRMERYGVDQRAVNAALAILLDGKTLGVSQQGPGIDPVDIVIDLPKSSRVLDQRLLSTPIPSAHGLVDLGDVAHIVREKASYPLFRRDGRYAEMVTADLAGAFEAPIYGMFAVEDGMNKVDWGQYGKPVVAFHGQPLDESHPTLLWDGEWEITYVTFRDMGAAFGVAILAIYLLIVAEFGSFKLPLVIMTPIPLTLIGIVLGHWLFHAPFTATSMIGFISLAGIIVRNSILLVDFIRHERQKGLPLRDCLLNAGAIRVRPILLTALAAMIGASFILLDPIFQGLAISLLFGLASSTILTLLVIPAIYVWLRDDGRPFSQENQE